MKRNKTITFKTVGIVKDKNQWKNKAIKRYPVHNNVDY